MPTNNPIISSSFAKAALAGGGGGRGELWSPKEKLCFSLLEKHQKTKTLTLTLTLAFSLLEIHGFILRHSIDTNPSILTRLISSFSEHATHPPLFSLLRHARRIFDCRPIQDTFLCNSMIRAHLQHRQFQDSLALYRDLRAEDPGFFLDCCPFYPDSYTFTFLAKSCASSAAMEREGRQIHNEVFKMGFCVDPFVSTTLLDMYAKFGCMESASLLFGEMPVKNPLSWTSMLVGYARNPGEDDPEKIVDLFRRMPEKDAAAFNAMIDVFAKSGSMQFARNLFEEMPERNVVSWTCLISGYCKAGDLESARWLFDEMPEKNLYSWNAMIGGYSQNRQSHRALELFRKLQSDKCPFDPDEVTIVSVLPAIADLGALDLGRWIHGYAQRNRLHRTTAVSTALIDMYAKCGEISRAKQVFDELPDNETPSWNAMINGLAINGCAEQALDLFMEMQRSGVEPNEVTMVGVLSACSHGGLVEDGRKWFRVMMEEYGFHPTIEHYGCMVDLLGRGGYLDEVERLIKLMPFEANGIVLSSLLFACGCYGDIERAERVMRRAISIEPFNLGNYVIMRNLYAGKRRWGDVEWVKGMMRRQNGNKKEVGCSVIEIETRVFEFAAGDRVHPASEVIYGVLNHLWLHMRKGHEEDIHLEPNL